jgi:serine/threonine-protein kinase
VVERDVRIGAVLAGKYRVERVLGQGGMGVVVEATQLDLERRVALKFLRKAALPEGPNTLNRFEREARTVAKLRGAHVVQVFDVGRLEHGEPFIVMELLQGEDLSAVLDREKRLPIATAVDYVLQACEAMAEAHVAGVVHRDLKPANLFLTHGPDGRPLLKVLDFGISKLMVAETTSLNLTSGVLGSPLYMSPEQLSSSKQIDYRTDIWSLGTILYELITGKAAFDADGLPQVCTRVMLGAPDRMDGSMAVPTALESAVLTCLHKTPEGRHPSVADLALALVPYCRGRSHRSAEAAIRIIRASNLAHGDLPYDADSLPPPAPTSGPKLDGSTDVSGPPSSVVRELNRADMSHDRTVNISASPLGLTQAELKPLVSPTALQPLPRNRPALPPPLLFGGLAVIVTVAALIGLRLGHSDAQSAGSELNAAPQPSAVVVAPTEPAPPLPDITPAVAPSAPAPAPLPSAKPAAKPSATPRKPRPASRPAAEPDAEQLLNHR